MASRGADLSLPVRTLAPDVNGTDPGADPDVGPPAEGSSTGAGDGMNLDDADVRMVVIEAAKFLETRQFSASMTGDMPYGDKERAYLEGWRDGYLRAPALLRSIASTIIVPDTIAELVEGEVVEGELVDPE